MTSNNDDTTTAEAEETFEVNLKLSKPVYQIARLICQFQHGLDWDSYISELVRKDVMTVKDGDNDSFTDYVKRTLKDEDW